MSDTGPKSYTAEEYESLSLAQRIARVSVEVGNIQATGKNQYGVTALSIEDVENALRDHLQDAGIGIFPRQLSGHANGSLLAKDGTAGGMGVYMLEKQTWIAMLSFSVVNLDSPDDTMEIDWADTGANPAAAISFCRKSFLKALFHLADDEEQQTGQGAAPRPAQTGQNKPKPAAQPPAQATTQKATGDAVKGLMRGFQQLVEVREALGDPASIKELKDECLAVVGVAGPISEISDIDTLKEIGRWIQEQLESATE